jgi:hypothetical protein
MKPPGFERLLDRLKQLARPVKATIVLSSIGIALYVGGGWLGALSRGRSLLQSTASTLLSMLIAVYPFVFATALFGLLLSAWTIARPRSQGDSQPGWPRRPRAARCFLVCATSLLGMVMAEIAAATWLGWIHRLPALPTKFVVRDDPHTEFTIVVLGGSSALGVPYQDWLSIGAIVGRELERAMPSHRFRVEVLAEMGATLEAMQLKLAGLTRRPDAMLVYSGHNEFVGRYPFSNRMAYYDDDPSLRRNVAWQTAVERLSPLLRLARENLDKQQSAIIPALNSSAIETVVGRPLRAPSEVDLLFADFQRRLEAIVAYCEGIRCLPILIIPPGNDSLGPSQSYLQPETRVKARRDFFHRFAEVRAGEQSNPAGAIESYREFIAEQPTHAQAHHRLARLLESAGEFSAANLHYVLARDYDALPMRCHSRLEAAYRTVAEHHPRSTILIDGPAVLRTKRRHGILDNHLFHDNVHPTLRGHAALAEAVLSGLKARAAFGWSARTAAPVLRPERVAAEFNVDAAAWATVCKRSALHYDRLAALLFDRAERIAWRDRYIRAAHDIEMGASPESIGLPGLGTAEEILRP